MSSTPVHPSQKFLHCVTLVLLAVAVCPAAETRKPASIEGLIRQKKFTEAEARIQGQFKKNPRDVHAFNLYGQLNRAQAKYGLAEAAFA